MSTPILATKLHIPSLRPKIVLRPRLIEQLNAGLHRKFCLVSAAAGFGKTTLVSEWINGCQRPVAWLSLDEEDKDLPRFFSYLVAALRTITPDVGEGVLAMLQSPQPPSIESLMTSLLNEITTVSDNFIIVLDDYHLIDSQSIDRALTFLLEHQPSKMHLVIATREDPSFPLARYRARGQLTELRAADLRFTPNEVTEFLNQTMELNLPVEEIHALESRTEGWIAGLQLAAMALQGKISIEDHQKGTDFIQNFSGSHRFVLDYLVEEVLQQQPERIQAFLLCTSILDRLCGPLCDAVLVDFPSSGQETLEYLEQANLFIVPLDDERQWYRYHHLFAELLRQRLRQNDDLTAGTRRTTIAEFHSRASKWFEENGLEVEAFHHAAAANDVKRAERLIEGDGMPLHFRGTVTPVLNWLSSLPTKSLDSRPSLWTTYASVLLVTGHTTEVEEKLQAAEAALAAVSPPGSEPDGKTKDLIGRIAAIRATLAATQKQIETIITQSQRALEYLHPENLPFRTSTIWKLGYTYQLQGNRAAASRAYAEVISIGQASGNTIFTVTAVIGLGGLREAENKLYLAAESYQHALELLGDQPLPVACVAHLGLARILYQWNDLDAAQKHGQRSIQLAQQIENSDSLVGCQIFLARLKLAQGNVSDATTFAAEAEQAAHRHNFTQRLSEVAACRVLILLQQGDLEAAAHLAETHELPLSRGRVYLVQGVPAAALEVLAPWRRQVEAKDWEDERLKVMVLQALAHQALGQEETAVLQLAGALKLADPGGFIRLFIDEGQSMAKLLQKARAESRGKKAYIDKLLAAHSERSVVSHTTSGAQLLVEPLSPRELEVLQLIAQGLSNREISERLFLALNTVKGHNRNIYGKLAVQRRTEAVARARELGLL